MAQTNKVICPDCGAVMNHHAVKVDYGTDDPATPDKIFGGALKEVHTCPECGRAEMRAAA
jgi:ribosomal protein S27AE